MSNPESSTSTDPIGALTAGQKLAGVYVLRRTASNPGSECPIWLAHDEVLGKDVSLHFVPASVRADTRAMNELRQEIKRNRQLIHPNILRVYDLIEEADWAAISMDWFEGESVASLLQQKEGGFFEPGDLKPWLQQICTALEDVHKINLVHRNISPPNLFIDKAGKVLIANFGISRVMDDAIGRKAKPGEAVERHLVYMSPQQLDGETPARTDDIYSLGVTIYELLAGQPPFVEGEILSQIRKATPQSMMERRAKIGKKGGTILPAWEKVIASCLAKTAAERPQGAQDLAAKLGLSGKLAPTEPPPPVPISNVVPMKMDRPGPPKKTVIIGKDAGKKDPPPPTPEKAPLTPASAPARSYAEIVAAVEADEREAARKEMQGSKTEKKNGTPDKEDASDLYPSLYPRKSKAPMVVFAMIVAAAGLGGYLWYISNNGQQNDEQTTDTGGQPHLSTGDVAGDNGGKSAANSENKEETQNEPAPPKANGIAEGSDSSQPPARDSIRRVSADITPAPHPETTAAKVEPPKSPSPGSTASVSDATANGSEGPLLAEVKPSAKSPRSATPAPASKATPAPVAAPPSSTATSVDPNQPVEKLQQAADAAAKKLQEARKQQQEAETAAAEAQKRLDERTKSTATLLESVKDLHNQRQQMDEKAKAADLAAEQAKQAAEEKSRAATESKKALADWDAKNGSKLAERDKAGAELQMLQKAQTDKKAAATEASKAVADAEGASSQVALALQKAQDAEKTKQAEEARRIATEKASKRAELDKQLQSVDAMRKELESKMKALEDLKKQIEEPAPSGSAVPPSPGGSQNSDTKASPAAPIASAPNSNKAVPPPAPPPPVPVLPAATGPMRETGANTSSTPTELAKIEPSALPPPHNSSTAARSEPPAETKNGDPKTGETKAGEGAGLFENSLGMKFAPVGDVLFCIWSTRVKDFEVFAKETGLKSTIWRSPGFKQGPDHPVVDVTWTEAMAFCKWLTERERKKGTLSSSQIFRLPTDLEWSKAVGLPEESGKTPEARDMGVPDVFPWGTQWPPPPNVGNYTGEETGSDVAIKGYDDGFAWTSPVGSFPPNKYGLYDMGGNVWQWCMDNWNNDSKAKVLRGASWYNGGLKLSLLSSCRVNENPDSSTDNYGFRVVRANESSRSKAK